MFRMARLGAAALMGVLVAGGSPAEAQLVEQLSSTVQAYVSVSDPVVALVGVTVVDGTGSPPQRNQTVVLRQGRIQAVGPSGQISVPGNARVLELPGHTVLPGLVGMHNHTFYTTRGRGVQLSFTAPRLYLASGITTLRTTGGREPYNEVNMAREVEQGLLPGPRIILTGPYITGRGGGNSMAQVSGPDEARRVVRYWAEEGATWFKAYTRISREELGAAIQEAHSRGLRFTGHLCSVSFQEAVALGIDNLEHGFFTNTDWVPNRAPDSCPSNLLGLLSEVDVASPEVNTTIRAMVENDVSLTSTLAVYELLVPGRPPLEERVLSALAPDARQEYLSVRSEIEAQGQGHFMVDVFRKGQAFELAYHRAGGLLAAGVDPTGIGGALPGYGDQRNFELLVEAGFTPVEVVQVMSLNGARILGMDDELGSVEVGKRGDLVVIQGDPISRPEDIRKVVTVFKDGVGYDAGRLEEAVQGLVGVR